MPTDTLMPTVFFGHGNPMNALEHNRYTEAWSQFGSSIPRPRAILVVSAHWYIHSSALTAMARPRTIHDFYGFPQSLFDVRYPAPGAPELVDEVADAVRPVWVGADEDSWGLDHGTWSVLVHAFPDADIPVVQLSINAEKPLDYHVDLGARLDALRRAGVLVVGSGNVVHNLRAIDPRRADTGTDWAHRFNEFAIDLMTSAPGDIGALHGHGDFASAAPTPDHLIPLLYIAGLAAANGDTARVIVDGYALGSLSMTSFAVGAPAQAPLDDTVGDGPARRPCPMSRPTTRTSEHQ